MRNKELYTLLEEQAKMIEKLQLIDKRINQIKDSIHSGIKRDGGFQGKE